jgi:hypothetical protein
MAPGPSSADQDILLFPYWTMSRLAGEDDLFVDTAHMELRFAKNLMVVLHDTSGKRTVSLFRLYLIEGTLYALFKRISTRRKC